MQARLDESVQPLDVLREQFGRSGEHLYQLAQGESPSGK